MCKEGRAEAGKALVEAARTERQKQLCIERRQRGSSSRSRNLRSGRSFSETRSSTVSAQAKVLERVWLFGSCRQEQLPGRRGGYLGVGLLIVFWLEYKL